MKEDLKEKKYYKEEMIELVEKIENPGILEYLHTFIVYQTYLYRMMRNNIKFCHEVFRKKDVKSI